MFLLFYEPLKQYGRLTDPFQNNFSKYKNRIHRIIFEITFIKILKIQNCVTVIYKGMSRKSPAIVNIMRMVCVVSI